MTDTITAAATPAEHRAAAEAALSRAAGVHPSSDTYRNYVQTAIARTLLAVAAYLEPPPVPQVPGLPPGWTLETIRSDRGNRRWGYGLTSPDGEETWSRFRWEYPGTALAEGIRHAVHLDAGLPHAGRWSDTRTDQAAGAGEEVPGA